MLIAWVLQMICRIRGHKFEATADAENGSEELNCVRCGYSEGPYYF